MTDFPIEDPELTRAEKIEAVIKWQTCPVVHPLTCGIDSNHRVLIPWLVGNSVILKCVDCEYVQLWVPEAVYGLYTTAKQTKDYFDALYGPGDLADTLRENSKEPVCAKCGIQLVPGRAIENTAVGGAPDFDESDMVVTMHVGGPGKMIDCLKCPGCGYSVKA